jgi:magnesium-transporting ATPase (P-type)
MNKKFLISWVVIFVAWMAGSFVVHGLLLGADYASAEPNMMRPEAEQQAMFHWMLIAHIMLAGAFVWIYDRGNEMKPWLQQGIRFGIAVALLAIVPVYLIYYAVQPTPGMLVVKQIVFDSTLIVILGIIVAFLNKPQATASQ